MGIVGISVQVWGLRGVGGAGDLQGVCLGCSFVASEGQAWGLGSISTAGGWVGGLCFSSSSSDSSSLDTGVDMKAAVEDDTGPVHICSSPDG